MRLKTWLVAALGLGSLVVLIAVSMLALSTKAQDIYSQLDQLNNHHRRVEENLRRLRSDLNLSGIFVRDYLLDVARERAPEYRQQIAEYRRTNMATLEELKTLIEHDEQIESLQTKLDEYWATFDPLFDWTIGEKIMRSAAFLRREVVPRREAALAIAMEIEKLNDANLAAQRAEVARQHAAFRADLHRLLWEALLLGLVVSLVVVFPLRALERRSEEQRAVAEAAEQQMRELSQRLVAAQEEERKSLSRELHDHVAQVLTALRMELGRIERTNVPADTGAGPAVVGVTATTDRQTGGRDATVVTTAAPRPRVVCGVPAQPAAESSRRFFTTLGSTGTPGPIVVVTVTFLRYLPLAADGLARSTSSRTAA